MYNWIFSFTKDISTEDKFLIAENILAVYRDAMGSEGWSVDEICDRAEKSTALGLLKDAKNNIGGYLLVTVPSEPLNDKHILWIDSISVRKALQKHGYYQRGIKKVMKKFSKYYTFGFVGGRSQNPLIFYLRDKLSDNKLYPFDDLYPGELMEYLINHVYEVGEPYDEGKLKNEDLKRGICRKIYKKGKLGDYEENIDRGRSAKFEAKLKEWDFQRQKGDALIIIKQL